MIVREVHLPGSYAIRQVRQVLENGIFVNWELAKTPVDDKPTYQDLTLPGARRAFIRGPPNVSPLRGN